MKGANGSTDGEQGQVTSEKQTRAGVLGPPPGLPDPNKGRDELVEEEAAAECWQESGARGTNRSMKTTDPLAGRSVNARIHAFDRRFPRDLGWEVVAP